MFSNSSQVQTQTCSTSYGVPDSPVLEGGLEDAFSQALLLPGTVAAAATAASTAGNSEGLLGSRDKEQEDGELCFNGSQTLPTEGLRSIKPT